MDILLVHGLGRSPYSLSALGSCLEDRGHTPHYFGYAAFSQSYDQIVCRLRQRIQDICQPSAVPYVLIGHSLGGLLCRSALLEKAIAPPVSLIMLGTPNQSPRIARWAWKLWPFQWFSQDCGCNLATPSFFDTLPTPPYPYHIIAGTFGWTGIASPFGLDLNDGLVALNETKIRSTDVLMTFPVFHTFMMNDPMVQNAIIMLVRSLD